MRAQDLRDRYRALFGGDELPVPVESIAEDYLGLSVAESVLDGLSGVLYLAERRIELNAEEPEPAAASPWPMSSATGSASAPAAHRRRCTAAPRR